MTEAAKEGVEAYDIIGPLIDQIEEITGQVPRYEPGVVRRFR